MQEREAEGEGDPEELRVRAPTKGKRSYRS